MSNPLAGYEETVICPYDKCHVIMKHRIQTHLIKCARNHAHIKLEVCPFDATHRFQSSEKKVRGLKNLFCQKNLIFSVYSNTWLNVHHAEILIDIFTVSKLVVHLHRQNNRNQHRSSTGMMKIGIM